MRERFDTLVDREWRRYSGSTWRVLVRELRDRFLTRHLPRAKGWVLELGPGPGRFTPTILGGGARVVATDLSRPMLRSLGRRLTREREATRLYPVRGAGERLPFRPGAFSAVIAYGNLLGFSAHDGDDLLEEIARVTRPGGRLVLDVASPVNATTEFLSVAAERRFLLRILRDPDHYFLSGVLGAEGRSHQPFAPERMGFWEFDFYTYAAVESLLRGAGFRPVDRMAVAPVTAFRETVTRIARRDRRAWENLLRVEEVAGRRTGALETGHGFVVAAVRTGRRRRSRSRG